VKQFQNISTLVKESGLMSVIKVGEECVQSNLKKKSGKSMRLHCMAKKICLTGTARRRQYPIQLFEMFGFGESQMVRVEGNDVNGGLGRSAVEESDWMVGEQQWNRSASFCLVLLSRWMFYPAKFLALPIDHAWSDSLNLTPTSRGVCIRTQQQGDSL
jgi:hypothetical protein